MHKYNTSEPQEHYMERNKRSLSFSRRDRNNRAGRANCESDKPNETVQIGRLAKRGRRTENSARVPLLKATQFPRCFPVSLSLACCLVPSLSLSPRCTTPLQSNRGAPRWPSFVLGKLPLTDVCIV